MTTGTGNLPLFYQLADAGYPRPAALAAVGQHELVHSLIDATRDSGARLHDLGKLEDHFQPAMIDVTHDGGARLVGVYTIRLAAVGSTYIQILPNPAAQLESPPTRGVPAQPAYVAALDWIKEAAGLPWERIAQLLGVTRQAVNDWRQGKPITHANRERLMAVRDVLERAQQRHPTREQLHDWLVTPRGVEARMPAEWLQEGNIGRARLLAITDAAPSDKHRLAFAGHAVPAEFRPGGSQRREPAPAEDDEALARLLASEDDEPDDVRRLSDTDGRLG